GVAGDGRVGALLRGGGGGGRGGIGSGRPGKLFGGGGGGGGGVVGVGGREGGARFFVEPPAGSLSFFWAVSARGGRGASGWAAGSEARATWPSAASSLSIVCMSLWSIPHRWPICTWLSGPNSSSAARIAK